MYACMVWSKCRFKPNAAPVTGSIYEYALNGGSIAILQTHTLVNLFAAVSVYT